MTLQVCWESKPKMEQSEAYTLVTPNTLVYGKDMYYLGDNIDSENGDLRKRAKYIRWYKDNAWEWWKIEYSKHTFRFSKDMSVTETIGPILVLGRDGVTRASKLRTGNSTLGWAMQQLYPLELRCDSKSQD